MAQFIKNRFVKIVLWLALSLFLLLIASAGAIQFPYVQTKLVNFLSEKYTSLLGYELSLERISIWWFDSIEIEGVKVIDSEENLMIKASSIDIDFDLSSLLDENNHNVDEIKIKEAVVHLTKIDVDTAYTLNINHFIRKIKALSRKQGGSKRKFLSCDNLQLINSRLEYNDQLKDSIADRFDYFHFTLDSINGSFDKVFSVKDTFGLHVKKLKGYDIATNLKIKNLQADFAVSQKAMQFDNLDLRAGNSVIKDSVRFEYSSTTDLSDFNNKVLINGHLENSVIDTRDLAYFAPQVKYLKEVYKVTGDMNGLVRNFAVKNAHILFGEGSSIRGKIRMTGLPDFQETFIDFDLFNSAIVMNDIKPYINSKTYSRLKPFDRIRFTAEFLGYPNDFVAQGNFYTQYGDISSDINLKLENDISKSSYSGALAIDDFDMKGFMKNELYGSLTMNGNIKGTGFTLETADFSLNGEVENIGIKNYNYQNILTNARFTKEFFEGNVKVNDSNLKLNVSGAIDLRAGLNFFNIKAELDTIDLKTLNITDESIVVKSVLDINAQGLKVDEILGAANLGKTYLAYRENSIQIDSLSLISDKDEDERIILLKTNLLNARVLGEFQITEVYKGMSTLTKEYLLNLTNDQLQIKDYYQAKNSDEDEYDLNYEINIKDLNPLLEVFAPETYISPKTKIEGSITGGYTSIISLNSSIDSLIYKQNTFLDNEIQLNISKISDSTSVLAMAYVNSKNQSLSGVGTKDLLFEGIWDNRHIDFEFDLFQVDFANRALLYGSVDFRPDSIDLKIQSSDLRILDEEWNISENNLISLSNKNLDIIEFSIYNGDQRLTIDGQVSENPNDKMELLLDSIDLGTLNTVLNKDLSGTINGYARLQDYYNSLVIENSLKVDSLEIDEFLIGDIVANSHWNNSKKQSVIDCNLKRLGFNIFDLSGTYSPYEKNSLNLIAELNDTELKIVEPFLGTIFSNISGKLNGRIKVKGTPYQPVFDGDGLISNAGLTINYLNTTYDFSGGFYLTKNQIGFSEITLTDFFGNTASLNGYIGHDYFKNMYIDMYTSLQGFRILNTTSSDNALFYGNGIATGNINFSGALSNMSIIANAKTDRGTRIYIPIGDTETIEQEEYINFVDFSSSDKIVDEENIDVTDLSGIKLDFDLDITSDAYCEIIFDIKSGDIIRGRGNGDLKLQIDTKGEFNMFGDYNIEQGGYNFTLYNLINKEFEILSGSKISWYGDPYQGILDINASYNQLASFLPLLEQPTTEEFELSDVVELRRKYPVNVLLEIDGALLSPSVDFDIKTGTLPRNIQLPDGTVTDLEFEFLKFKNSIDEQELKRQVFSLIILRKFSPLQSFDTGGSITSSVSELFSNQLSYWITQVDENLEIDVDFGQLDDEAFNTFQLRLSYTFLDGRLRVTRDGGFTNQANQADVSSIAGDWTVEYLLTPDGKFKAKMYNRTNYNPINPNEENQNTVTTGFSLIHTQSFDELKDLFKKSRERSKENNEESDDDLFFNTEASIPKEDEIN